MSRENRQRITTLPAIWSDFFFCFDLADKLGHGAHGAEAAPGSGLEQHIYRQTDDGGGEHDAVEAEGVLGDPVGDGSCGVGPAPGNTEHPQELDGLPKALRTCGHQPGLEDRTGQSESIKR